MNSVLIVSQILPYKSHNGGSTQIRNLITALNKIGIKPDFVSFDMPEADTYLYEEVKTFLSQNTNRYFIVPLDNLKKEKSSCDSMIEYYSKNMEESLRDLSKNRYSVIFFEFTSMGRYLNIFKGFERIINIHELNFLRQLRENNNQYNIKDRIYLLYKAFKSLKSEVNILSNAEVILSYNEREIEILKLFMPDKNIQKIPITIDMPERIKPLQDREFDFIFIGNFDHKPNRDSMEFILSNFDKILRGKKLLIGGRYSELIKRGNIDSENIYIAGDVFEPNEFLQRGRILLFPVFTGGGSRVKVIEAMANGNLVITTREGAEGLNAIEKKGVFILNRQEFLSGKPSKIAENYSNFMNLIEQNIKNVETFHNINESLRVRRLFVKL